MVGFKSCVLPVLVLVFIIGFVFHCITFISFPHDRRSLLRFSCVLVYHYYFQFEEPLHSHFFTYRSITSIQDPDWLHFICCEYLSTNHHQFVANFWLITTSLLSKKLSKLPTYPTQSFFLVLFQEQSEDEYWKCGCFVTVTEFSLEI